MGIRLTVLIVSALFVASCSAGSDPATVSYEASAEDGGELQVAWIDENGDEVVETVSSPWTLEFEVNGSYRARVVATNLDDEGRVACRINGSDFRDAITTGGEESATCRGTVTRSGGSVETSTSTDFTEFTRDASGAAVRDEAEPIRLSVSEVRSAKVVGDVLMIGGGSAVVLVDLESLAIVKFKFRGLQVAWEPTMSPTGTIFVANCIGDQILVAEPGDEEFRPLVEDIDGCVSDPVWTPSGVWLHQAREGTLLAIDESGGILHTVDVPGDVADLAWIGLYVFVSLRDDPRILLVDVNTGEEAGAIALEASAGELRADGDTLLAWLPDRREYLAIEPDGTQTVVDAPAVVAPDGARYAQRGTDIVALDTDDERSIEVPEGTLVAAASTHLLVLDGEQLVRYSYDLFG